MSYDPGSFGPVLIVHLFPENGKDDQSDHTEDIGDERTEKRQHGHEQAGAAKSEDQDPAMIGIFLLVLIISRIPEAPYKSRPLGDDHEQPEDQAENAKDPAKLGKIR